MTESQKNTLRSIAKGCKEEIELLDKVLENGVDFDISYRCGVISEGTRILKEAAERFEEESRNRRFEIGDVIAYRTLKDGEPEWVAWEVGEIDDKYLYANAAKNNNIQDNIAIGSAFLVKAAEDNR